MIGVGRTVFTGSKLEDFKVEVLGVLRNVIGPKRSLILARLEGDLERPEPGDHQHVEPLPGGWGSFHGNDS